MSFPRAKIQRFNEKLPSTPSPADYNIDIKKGTPGAVIPKSDRFSELKSPNISDNGSAASVSSTPCFRTPTLPKKKKSIFTLSARKPKASELFSKRSSDLEALKDKIVECNNKDSYIKDLIEQIEEMKCKLATLEKQKQELSNECNKFEQAYKELKEEQRISLQNIYLEHDTETTDLKRQLKKLEVELLNYQQDYQMLDVKKAAKIAELSNEINKFKNNHAESLVKINEAIKDKEIAIEETKNLKIKLENKLLETKESHSKEIEQLITSHKEELSDLEFTMLSTISEMQAKLDKEKSTYEKNLDNLKRNFEAEKVKILEDTKARIKQLEEDSKEANVLAEIQMQEKCQDIKMTWELKLEQQEKQADAILKECQAISEYSIIQCELEKKEVKINLTKTTEELQIIQKENADLVISFRDMELKYNDLDNTLKHKSMELAKQQMLYANELERHQKELLEELHQKKLYEISINKSHETIEMLKKRLLSSDNDVEQLKAELERSELSKHEIQLKLSEQLHGAYSKIKTLELQYENTIKDTEGKILQLECNLLGKLEEYKVKAEQEITGFKSKIAAKERDLEDSMEQLHAQQSLNSQAQKVISSAQKTMDELEESNETKEVELIYYKQEYVKHKKQFEEIQEKLFLLQTANAVVQEQLDSVVMEKNALEKNVINCECKNKDVGKLLKQIAQLQEKCESYSQYCDYYKGKVMDYEKEIDELNGINKKYIEQSGKYDNLLQKHEALETKNAALEKIISDQESLIGPFREQLEAYEMEHNALLSQKSEAEMEAKNMGLKYAQLLGHQNQKQKIKHMMDLKAKNHELSENKKDMETKLKTQARTIEKLKKELSALASSPRKSKLASTDKENISSPNRTLNSSRVESPCGPLRDRN